MKRISSRHVPPYPGSSGSFILPPPLPVNLELYSPFTAIPKGCCVDLAGDAIDPNEIGSLLLRSEKY